MVYLGRSGFWLRTRFRYRIEVRVGVMVWWRFVPVKYGLWL